MSNAYVDPWDMPSNFYRIDAMIEAESKQILPLKFREHALELTPTMCQSFLATSAVQTLYSQWKHGIGITWRSPPSESRTRNAESAK